MGALTDARERLVYVVRPLVLRVLLSRAAQELESDTVQPAIYTLMRCREAGRTSSRCDPFAALLGDPSREDHEPVRSSPTQRPGIAARSIHSQRFAVTKSRE